MMVERIFGHGAVGTLRRFQHSEQGFMGPDAVIAVA
jgi:hypothetical protein